jgi:hypothetical protein
MPVLTDTAGFKVPVLQIQPWGLLLYERWEGPRRRHIHQLTDRSIEGIDRDLDNGKQKPPGGTYSGDVGREAARNIKRAINTLLAISTEKEVFNYRLGSTYKFRLSFITLTLPSPQGSISDKEIKRGPLRVFIQKMGRRYGMYNYVWKAEKQKNGNIHFHITTDVYIPWWKIRDNWNDCINRLGFVDRYQEKHGKKTPNSTDVHSVRNVKDLAAYMVKYMAKKNKEGQKIEGKVWGCSKNLTGRDRAEAVIDTETADWVNEVISKYPENVIDKDYCSFVRLNQEQWKAVVTGRWKAIYDDWIKRVREKGKRDALSPPRHPGPRFRAGCRSGLAGPAAPAGGKG